MLLNTFLLGPLKTRRTAIEYERKEGTTILQKGYCEVTEREIKPRFEFESISVLLLRESGGGTCQRVEEEEEI